MAEAAADAPDATPPDPALPIAPTRPPTSADRRRRALPLARVRDVVCPLPSVEHVPAAAGQQLATGNWSHSPWRFLYHDGLAPVLEEMPRVLMAAIERPRMAG